MSRNSSVVLATKATARCPAALDHEGRRVGVSRPLALAVARHPEDATRVAQIV